MSREIRVSYALREQGPNMYMLTEGVKEFSNAPQIFVCRKREVSPAFWGEYCFLDEFDTTATTHTSHSVAAAMALCVKKGDYVATIDSQIEIAVKRKLFDTLSEYLYPAWVPDYVFSSLNDQPSAFLVLLRVYRVAEAIPEDLLQKGRQGAAMVFRLYSGETPTSCIMHVLQPVLPDSKFEYIKRELIHTVKVENAFIECYENDECGRKALGARAEIRRAFAPRRAVESQPVDRAHLDYETIYDRILSIDPSLGGLVSQVRAIIPPQWGEADSLVKRAQAGDESARIRLLEMFMRVVLKNALWMHDTYAVSLDGAIQESGIGLLTAIEKYNADDQSKFSVYAPWWMRQRMMRELSVRERIVRLPIHFRERIIRITPLVDNHMCEACIGASPCRNLLAEIRDELVCDEANALFAWSFTQFPYSIEDLCHSGDATELFSDCGAEIQKIDEAIDALRAKQVIHNAFSTLRPREQEILEKRYGFNGNSVMTLEEVGSIYSVTRERIRQIESKAIAKLRHPSQASKLYPFF